MERVEVFFFCWAITSSIDFYFEFLRQKERTSIIIGDEILFFVFLGGGDINV